MKPRQTAILSAAVILPLVAILWEGSTPDTPSPELATSSGSAPPTHRERSSSTAERTPRASGRSKDFRSFLEKATSTEGVKLSPAEIENYLSFRNRDVESLLVAFRMTLDKALIDEALEKSPNDPEVILCALSITTEPGKRLELIESFKRNDPENAIGNCLAARVLMKLGRKEDAIAELSQSAGKSIQDFTVESSQAAEEAYLSAGYSPMEAKAAALFSTTNPTIVQVAGTFFKELDALRKEQELSGNPTAAQSLRDIQNQLGHTFQQGGNIIDAVVGIAYERNAWRDVESPEAQAYLQQLDLRKETILKEMNRVLDLRDQAGVPDTDWLLYMDRLKTFGAQAANDWMLRRHPGH